VYFCCSAGWQSGVYQVNIAVECSVLHPLVDFTRQNLLPHSEQSQFNASTTVQCTSKCTLESFDGRTLIASCISVIASMRASFPFFGATPVPLTKAHHAFCCVEKHASASDLIVVGSSMRSEIGAMLMGMCKLCLLRHIQPGVPCKLKAGQQDWREAH
jgi:hypothetical protein